MPFSIRPYGPGDLAAMCGIWNEVVRAGDAFPQEEELTPASGAAFFAGQTGCGVAEDAETGAILGLYILHPNNVGRCGHIANASYAVRGDCRGRGVGEALVRDSLSRARGFGFRAMQFNAVVAGNARARALYERIGFRCVGRVEGGFRLPDGRYEMMLRCAALHPEQEGDFAVEVRDIQFQGAQTAVTFCHHSLTFQKTFERRPDWKVGDRLSCKLDCSGAVFFLQD